MLEWLEGWVVVDLMLGAIRATPYTLLFLAGFMLTQGLLAAHAAVEVGNHEAVRQMLHGAFLDGSGLAWTLGISLGLVVVKGLVRLGDRWLDRCERL